MATTKTTTTSTTTELIPQFRAEAVPVLHLVGCIDRYGNNLAMLKEQYEQLGNPLVWDMHVDSPGGDLYEGYKIYEWLRALVEQPGARMRVRIQGICGSIASLIAMAAPHISITSLSRFCIHNPYLESMSGDATQLEKAAKELRQLEMELAAIYAARTGLPQAEILALMARNELLSANEALKLQLVDAIEPPARIVAWVDESTAAAMNSNNSNNNTINTAGIAGLAESGLDGDGAENSLIKIIPDSIPNAEHLHYYTNSNSKDTSTIRTTTATMHTITPTQPTLYTHNMEAQNTSQTQVQTHQPISAVPAPVQHQPARKSQSLAELLRQWLHLYKPSVAQNAALNATQTPTPTAEHSSTSITTSEVAPMLEAMGQMHQNMLSIQQEQQQLKDWLMQSLGSAALPMALAEEQTQAKHGSLPSGKQLHQASLQSALQNNFKQRFSPQAL